MIKNFYNENKDVIVKFSNDFEFVIIGDDLDVTEKEIVKMSQGIVPKGWVPNDF